MGFREHLTPNIYILQLLPKSHKCSRKTLACAEFPGQGTAERERDGVMVQPAAGRLENKRFFTPLGCRREKYSPRLPRIIP
jgi:hypothetical protein